MQNQRLTDKQRRVNRQKCVLCGRPTASRHDLCPECNEKLDNLLYTEHPGTVNRFFEDAIYIPFGYVARRRS